ncbi:MAG: response regulator, partial [Myxococcales bacterium]|nr:response regulator [Myxococcales bacterium]
MAEGPDRIGQRIVVVDDERNIRRTLSMVLEGEGYEVETFESAEEFIPRLPQGRIDVLLLDVRLPGIDGIELLQKVKDEQPNLPVLMISGHASIEDAVKAMAIGAVDFMEKPLSRETVLARVKKAVEDGARSARLRALEAEEGGEEEMLGRSEVIQKVRNQIAKV